MHEGHRARLREKLLSHGESLTDIQVLELILFDCISRKDTNPVAHELLDCFGSLSGVFSASPRLLCAVAGVGPRTAEHIYLTGLAMERIRASRAVRRRLQRTIPIPVRMPAPAARYPIISILISEYYKGFRMSHRPPRCSRCHTPF